MNASPLAARDRKRMRQIAHHLDPVILVGDAGVTDSVIAETTRALLDHELIKVRIAGEDRTARQAGTERLAEACGAQIVQTIGKVVVLYRRNPDAKPKLSNLSRFGA
ncbi:MAG TPA: ribosome assembly RNA-binding protein YhbY [Gammaproteobacteria bacterium]|jgi:RNA-binding protein|nr:ribosome assembly RNA-binding protein YhbY [Gammaproteobacteria bacterium]